MFEIPSIRVHKPHRVPPTIAIRSILRVLLKQLVNAVPHRCNRIAIACPMVVQPRNIVQLFTAELKRILVSGSMLVDQRFTVWRIPYKLADVTRCVGQVAGAAEVYSNGCNCGVYTPLVPLSI